MRTSCPACGAEMTLDVLIAHQGAREAVAAAMMISAPLGKRLIDYISLFRPAQRQLTLDRFATLLNELLPQIQSARIDRNGRAWVVPVETWKLGLEEVVNKRASLTLPLKTHGYLYEVLLGMVGKHEAAQEAQHNERLASGARADQERRHGPVRLDASLPKVQMPEHIREQLREVKGRIKERA